MAKKRRSSRDQDWIAEALRQFERPLVRYAYRLTRDIDRSREIVQEVFLRLCREDCASVEDHVKEWLYTVCRNLALDQLKKSHPTLPLDDGAQESSQRIQISAPAAETPSKIAELNIQANRILGLIEQLSEDQQEVLRLKFQDDLTYAEISKITGHSVSNVGFLIHTAIKRTQELLRELREGSYGSR